MSRRRRSRRRTGWPPPDDPPPPNPPDDGVRDRTDDPVTLRRLLVAALRLVSPTDGSSPVVERRWTLAALRAAEAADDLRVTVKLGFAGPGADVVTVHLTPTEPATEPATEPPTEPRPRSTDR